LKNAFLILFSMREISEMRNILTAISIFFFCLSQPMSASTATSLAVPANLRIDDGSNPTSQTTTSISQYGITWTFAEPVEYGQFVNGDYWVVDPGGGVKVINISPGHTLNPVTGRHMHGSMLNPSAASKQGYDSYRDYELNLNAGIGVSESTPLVLTGNNSLVSTISNYEIPNSNESYVNTAAVLSCLNADPADGSFRPGISSTRKTIHNISSLDYTKLAKLKCPITKPDIESYADYLNLAFLTHIELYTARNLHPSASGLSNYYYPITFAEIALMLHLDYTDEQKKKLLINFVQLGIDIYSYLEIGRSGWYPNGGHSSGLKWPILFAGIMLNDNNMKNIGQISGDYLYTEGYGPGSPPPDYKHFAEDGQTFYVTQSDVDITSNTLWVNDRWRQSGRYLSFDKTTGTFSIGNPGDAIIGPWNPDTRNDDADGNVRCTRYSESMIGMPEWGIRHSTEPQTGDASWGEGETYRAILSCAPAWAGTSLAARIMGAKNLWNNNAHFDYLDRYMAISNGDPDPFGYKVPNEKAVARPVGLIGKMWDAYRFNY
jgi:hypothetical protein